MQLEIGRGELLSTLQSVIGVVERRQALPILSNVLLRLEGDQLRVSATDMELEIERQVTAQNLEPGAVTAPARKLLDICRGLPEGVDVRLQQTEEGKLTVRSSRSRFVLSTLPAADYPEFSSEQTATTLEIQANVLRNLMQKTQFAMGVQDVRYYLNGLLLELSESRLRAVATDGHRLAMTEASIEGIAADKVTSVIVPRKTVLEIQRLLAGGSEVVRLRLGSSQLVIEMDGLVLRSKLIDGRYPEYQRVIPDDSDRTARGDREAFRAALSRIAILANEKFRGVRLAFERDVVKLQAHNPENEEAEEDFELEFTGEPMEIGFNVSYLMDALSALETDQFELQLKGPDHSCLLSGGIDSAERYVVMPMRL
jgi:DNA polymerase III, beta subunit